MSVRRAASDEVRLADLHRKGAAQPGLSPQEFDWTLRPIYPRAVSRDVYQRLVSQLYHGEVMALRLCRHLLPRLDSAPAKDCLHLQIEDERRHAVVYERYLQRLGGVAPPAPALLAALRSATAWQGAPAAVVLACHVLLEGEVLRLNDEALATAPCPLLLRITARVARDEARHVAFGRIYLRHALAALPRRERREIYLWLRRLWMTAAEDLFAGLLPIPLTPGLRRSLLLRRWRQRAAALVAGGLFAPGDIDEPWPASGHGDGEHLENQPEQTVRSVR